MPGITYNKAAQEKSLEWIRQQAMDPKCIEALGNHDPKVVPHVIEF